jgi:hypothetical protein
MLESGRCSTDKNYKKWLKEIVPFKQICYIKIPFIFFKICITSKKDLNKDEFEYYWDIFKLNPINKDLIYLKWSIDGVNKVFFEIRRELLTHWKIIFIDKIIVLDPWKWLWKRSIDELCKYYNIFDIEAKPSKYGAKFWNKMKKEYQWQINIKLYNKNWIEIRNSYDFKE